MEIWSKYAALDEAGDPYRGHAGMRDWREEIYRNFDLHEVFADDVRDFGRPARDPRAVRRPYRPRACSRFDRWGPESQSASRRASTGSSPRRSASM